MASNKTQEYHIKSLVKSSTMVLCCFHHGGVQRKKFCENKVFDIYALVHYTCDNFFQVQSSTLLICFVYVPSPLSSHAKKNKQTYSGRVLTSVECIEALEKKRKEKEAVVKMKELRRKERMEKKALNLRKHKRKGTGKRKVGIPSIPYFVIIIVQLYKHFIAG